MRPSFILHHLCDGESGPSVIKHYCDSRVSVGVQGDVITYPSDTVGRRDPEVATGDHEGSYANWDVN